MDDAERSAPDVATGYRQENSASGDECNRPNEASDQAGQSRLDAIEEINERITAMAEWAKSTQNQLKSLMAVTQVHGQKMDAIDELRSRQDVLAQQLLQPVETTEPAIDPVIGYLPTAEQQGQLFAALAEWQAAAKPLEKGRLAEVMTKNGGVAQYRYADIASVSEIARTAGLNGLAHFHRELEQGNRFIIRTYLVHKGGGWIFCDVPVMSRENRLTSAMQQWGAASTTARRYGLFMVFGIAAGEEDDDGAERSASRTGRTAAAARRPGPAAPHTSPVGQPHP